MTAASDDDHTIPDEEAPVASETTEATEEGDGGGGGGAGRKVAAACSWKKIVIGAFLVGVIAFVVVDALTNKRVGDGIRSFLEWIEENPGPGVVAFAVVYFVATVMFIPGSILTLGAGFVFAEAFDLGIGLLLGVLSVFVGASAGALASFLLGRYLLRDWVTAKTKNYPVFEALDKAFEEKGLRIMTLLRLSPIIPFNAINYISGVTAISFSAYATALIAILPGTALYVFLGASAGSLADSADGDDNLAVTIVVIVAGIVFGIAAIAATSCYAKKELNRITEARRAELEGGGADGARFLGTPGVVRVEAGPCCDDCECDDAGDDAGSLARMLSDAAAAVEEK